MRVGASFSKTSWKSPQEQKKTQRRWDFISQFCMVTLLLCSGLLYLSRARASNSLAFIVAWQIFALCRFFLTYIFVLSCAMPYVFAYVCRSTQGIWRCCTTARTPWKLLWIKEKRSRCVRTCVYARGCMLRLNITLLVQREIFCTNFELPHRSSISVIVGDIFVL